MTEIINRRKFLASTSLSAAGLVLGSKITGCSSEKDTVKRSYDIMKEVMRYRKIDAHDHPSFVTPGLARIKDLGKQIDTADRLGIERLVICNAASGTPDQTKAGNDEIINAVKKYPDRFIGFFSVNPNYPQESLEEIKRCVDMGMAGYKGGFVMKVNDPLYYPVIEKLIDLKMICFMHAELQLGVGGYRMKYDIQERPNATIPEDMADVAARYPEAMFQWAHIASGDFEYICKLFKKYPNIYVDVSGSNNEEKHVDFCLEQLGEDRLFFGSDGSYYQAVGKILASNLTESQKKKIFFENFNNMLKKGGHHVA